MKYIFLNDISHIFKRQRKIFIIYFISIIIISIFYSIGKMDYKEVISIVLGNNYTSTSLYIEVIMYLLNLFICIYFIFDIYTKDLRYQLDNIFLRMKPIIWIEIKFLSFLLFMYIFKLLEYFIIIFIIFLFKHNMDFGYILKLFITDYIYYIFIQYLSLMIYIMYFLLEKFKIFIMIIIFIISYYFPKNIISCYSSLTIMIIVLYILFIILKILFKYKSKKIIQKVGKI